MIHFTKGTKEALGKLLIENVVVLAIDKQDADKTEGIVTLALTPEDALRVATAQEQGTLSLVLRRYKTEDEQAQKKPADK